jgi:pheromone shutdown protein TraB
VSGAKVYLVGTAHFSKESCDDVSLVIQAVQPDIVLVELCKQVLCLRLKRSFGQREK